jgi:hypothetical protein
VALVVEALCRFQVGAMRRLSSIRRARPFAAPCESGGPLRLRDRNRVPRSARTALSDEHDLRSMKTASPPADVGKPLAAHRPGTHVITMVRGS